MMIGRCQYVCLFSFRLRLLFLAFFFFSELGIFPFYVLHCLIFYAVSPPLILSPCVSSSRRWTGHSRRATKCACFWYNRWCSILIGARSFQNRPKSLLQRIDYSKMTTIQYEIYPMRNTRENVFFHRSNVLIIVVMLNLDYTRRYGVSEY